MRNAHTEQVNSTQWMWMNERNRDQRETEQQRLEKERVATWTGISQSQATSRIKLNWILTWCIIYIHTLLVSFCRANENGKIGSEALLYLQNVRCFSLQRTYIAVIFAAICWFDCTNWKIFGTVWLLLLFWRWMVYSESMNVVHLVCSVSFHAPHSFSAILSLFSSLLHTQSLSVCMCACAYIWVRACVCVDVWILLSLAQYHHFIRLNSQRFKHHSYESIDSVQIVTLFRKHLSHTHYPSVRFYLPFFAKTSRSKNEVNKWRKRNRNEIR